MATAPRPMPADFAIKISGLRDKQSCRIFGVGVTTLNRWKHEAGIVRPYRHATPPREHIQRLTDTMTQRAAAKVLGVSRPTFRKMQIEAGVLA